MVPPSMAAAERMGETFDVAAALKTPGHVSYGFLRVGGSTDGQSIDLPVAVCAGRRPGPIVWINGSIHGDEYLGTAALARFLPTLDPEEVSGRLVVTPILNPPAFRAMRRTSPVDEVDLNRIWSGAGEPFATAQVRDTVVREILDRCDILVDLHSGGNRFLQSPFVVYPRAGHREGDSAVLAKACGIPVVWAHHESILTGGLITAAARRDKAAVLIEIGGEGKAEEPWIEAMVRALRGLLVAAGTLRGTPRFLSEYRVFDRFLIVSNRHGGLWRRAAEPGAEVGKDEPLGRVLDPFGREVEVVRAPEDAIVLGICTYGAVASGDYIAELGHDVRLEGPPAGPRRGRSPAGTAQ